MNNNEIDNIILQICSLRRSDEVANFSFSPNEAQEIAQRAATHGVAAWALQRIDTNYCGSKSIDIIKNALKSYSLIAIIDNQNKCQTYFNIAQILAKNNINIVALKGISMMMGYYPEIALRSIGDIDILIEHKDVYRAHKLLLDSFPQNFTKQLPRTHILTETIRTHLPALLINNVPIEIHHNLYSRDSNALPKCDILQHVSQNKIGNQTFQTFDAALMLYHLSTHALKSKRSKGLRINWIIDIAVIFNRPINEIIDICQQALLFNKNQRKELISFWQHIFSILPTETSQALCKHFNICELPMNYSYLQNTNEGIKNSISWHIKTFCVITKEISKALKTKKGFRNKMRYLSDMIWDLKNRKTIA